MTSVVTWGPAAGARQPRRSRDSREPNEGFRFGYVVEVNPYDPDSTPYKRTALERFKHEGAETTLTDDGRPVAVLGDDERIDTSTSS
jgi:uncharacterized protein